MDEFLSPVLKNLQAGQASNPPPESTACRSCPASLWMLSGHELRNFCRVLHVMTWSDEEETAPDQCDGREEAIAEVQKSKGG